MPPGHQVEPPRLGYVGAAEFSINRRLEFGKPGPEPGAVEETTDFGMGRAVSKKHAPPAVDPTASIEKQALAAVDTRMLQTLGSLRRAAWFVVCLLVSIFIVTLLKR